MKFEFEEFRNIEDLLTYMTSVAPYMKQLLPLTIYKGYTFSIVPLTQSSLEILMMIYAKGTMDEGIIEFDISSRKYKKVTSIERADRNYFVILAPIKTTIADAAIDALEKST